MPDDFNKVFPAELRVIRARRKRLGHESTPRPDENSGKDRDPDDLFGICFSGGGIRSATFNLGVLQGLAGLRLLGFADYLSTVSGGGYIGSWLHALWHRKAFDAKYQDVEDYLAHETSEPEKPEKDPITFLRKFSNYLAPSPSLFGADTWTIFSVWLRNTILNQIILFLVLAAMLVLPLIAANFVRRLGSVPGDDFYWPLALAGTAILFLGIAVYRLSENIRAIVKHEFDANSHDQGEDDDISIWHTLVAPIYAGAALLSVPIACVTWDRQQANVSDGLRWLLITLGLLALVALFAVSVWASGFSTCATKRGTKPAGVFGLGILIVVVCTLATAGLLALVWRTFHDGSNSSVSVLNIVTWCPPLTMLALSSGIALQVGLMGIDFPDSAREWYARLGAHLAIVGVVWTAVFAVSGFVPMMVIWFFQTSLKTGIGALFTWAATTFAGIQAGKSAASSGAPPANAAVAPTGNSAVELIAQVAPPVAVAGLLVAIATLSFFAIDATVDRLHGQKAASAAASAPPQVPKVTVTGGGNPTLTVNWNPGAQQGFWDGLKSSLHDYPATSLSVGEDALLAGAALLVFLAGLGLSARVNINEFSMNHFYKNRLVRCYLGASNHHRVENRFTGFDPRDDIPLTELGSATHEGPYPILNSSLNLNHGSELAWQERKATCFIFTPQYCGYTPSSRKSAEGAYFNTDQFTHPGGPHLGLVTAICGAAANPNWGYHTNPVTAFLMTVFNVRLGWWIGNTLFPESARSYGPTVALKYLFYELFGLTTEKTKYLNLSDGGHFENLGIYELLRRKCRFIIVGDGEQDQDYVFESLGGAIRKARIDFGADISISPKRIFLQNQLSTVHCATGKIRYNDGSPGTILYVKASLTGDESYDVTQYKKAHPTFPQDSTLDQFFTESQFESYRALGRHAVENIFARIVDKNHPIKCREDIGHRFDLLTQYWLPPSTADPGAFTRHAAAYSALLDQLRADKDLRFLDAELMQGCDAFPRPPADSAEMNRARLLVSNFIQLMENVYIDLNLEDVGQEEHPQNSGWIVLFRHWKTPGGVLDAVWDRTKHIYSNGFQRFYARLKPL